MSATLEAGHPFETGPDGAVQAPQPPSLAEVRGRFAVLEQSPSLYTLPPAQLRALARRSRSERLAAGAVLFRQGDHGETMYVVESGRCEISAAAPGGPSVAVSLAGPGDSLGEEAALLGEPRATTVRAITDAQLVVLDREALVSALPPDSEEAEEVLRLARQRRSGSWLLASWGNRIGSAERARCVAVYSPKGGSGRTTVALNLAAQLGRAHPGEVVLVDLALPYNDVALMANLVPTGALALLGEAQTQPQEFEEALLSAALPHPAGFLVLPGALQAEHAELVGPELVERAAEVLRRSFRFVLFDLAPQLSSPTLTVLEGVDDILLLVNSELSSLKDFKEVRRVFEEVLRIPRSRVIVALNHRSPRSVIDRAGTESALGQPLVCEFEFEGAKLDRAAVRGEILALAEPRGPMARAAGQIAALLDPQAPPSGPATAPGRRRRIRGLR